jgi:hypothetical protein
MQKGSLIRSSRRQGPDVWEYRWRESCSGQTRKHRRIVIGSLNIPKDESAALNSNRFGRSFATPIQHCQSAISARWTSKSTDP